MASGGWFLDGFTKGLETSNRWEIEKSNLQVAQETLKKDKLTNEALAKKQAQDALLAPVELGIKQAELTIKSTEAKNAPTMAKSKLDAENALTNERNASALEKQKKANVIVNNSKFEKNLPQELADKKIELEKQGKTVIVKPMKDSEGKDSAFLQEGDNVYHKTETSEPVKKTGTKQWFEFWKKDVEKYDPSKTYKEGALVLNSKGKTSKKINGVWVEQ